MGEKSEVIFELFGIFDVTGEVIAMWVILFLIAILSIIATRNLKLRPGRFQNIMETAIEKLDGFFSGIIGKKNSKKYFCFLGSLFIFIIVSNYSGLIPGMGMTPYVKTPTASLSCTLGLGIVTFIFLQSEGIKAGLKGYFKKFVSPMFFMLPLLLIDEFIKPASLALRLFGNVFGDETVTEELYGIFPIGAPAIMMGLSLLFCAIQAVVYTMLVSIYLEEQIER